MKEKIFRRSLNIASDGADVTCDGGRLFQKLAPETRKARLPTVARLNGEQVSRYLGLRQGNSSVHYVELLRRFLLLQVVVVIVFRSYGLWATMMMMTSPSCGYDCADVCL